MNFVVKLGEEVVGYSNLEYGDPSMGCASGRLVTTAAYAAIQQYCIEHSPDWEPLPSLTICLPDGTVIDHSGGIQIIDLSPELGTEGLSIDICGINYPPYAELFPEHWAKHYEGRRAPDQS